MLSLKEKCLMKNQVWGVSDESVRLVLSIYHPSF